MINELGIDKKTLAKSRKAINDEDFLPDAVKTYLTEGLDKLAAEAGYHVALRYGEPSLPQRAGEVLVAIHLTPLRESEKV